MNPAAFTQKVSIITACLNSERYLERAIQSVLSQSYKNIEHIIIDGGSADNTTNIIKKYKDHISYWVSEPDTGIYDAMNKGIKQATGDIIYFLNSDDRFYDTAVIKKAADYFNRDKNIDFLYGNVINSYADSPRNWVGKCPALLTKMYLIRNTIAHQATFFRKRCFEKTGLFDTRYKILSDYDWYLRAFYKHRLRYRHINQMISFFQHGGISTIEEYETCKRLERRAVQEIYFTPLELQMVKWSNLFIYGDFFRIIGRLIFREKGYQLIVSCKNKLFCKTNQFKPMKPKELKVLYIIETLGMGGAEKLLAYILRNMDKNKFHPEVICLFDKMDIKEDLISAGIPVFCLNLKSGSHWWRAIFKLYRLIKKEKFDIVHTHLYFANIYGRVAAKLAGVDTIISTLHNPDYTYEDNGKWTYKIRKAIDKYTARVCNSGFIAVSEHVKKDFEKHLNLKDIRVIYNCIDTSRFRKMDIARVAKKRDELGLAEDDFVLLNIGRLHPQKGQLYLIEAFNLLCKNNPKYKLLIIGKGTLEFHLREKISGFSLGKRIMLLKDRSDVPEIMSACDMFILPSLYDGLSIALIEAMASGLPIIASDIDAVKGVIRDNREGLLVERENTEKLAEAIFKLTEDKRLRFNLGQNAKLRAIEMFDVGAHIKNLENIYKGLM